MHRPEFAPDTRPADPASRRRPVLRVSPEAPGLGRVDPRVKWIAAFALVDRALTAPPPGVPLSRAERRALYGPSAAQDTSRLVSAPASPAPVLDVGALGAPVPAADGVALRLPPWMTRLAPYPGQPHGEVCWGGGTFRPWSAGAGRRGQAEAGGEPPITTLELRLAESGAVPAYGPTDAVGVYVEGSSCREASGGRALRIHACRFRHADYPHADVDEYVVTAAWALGAGTWLALAGRSYTRAGQDVLLAAVRTLRRA